ncbi:MAG: hypothetical protein WAW06_02045 [bacterium]
MREDFLRQDYSSLSVKDLLEAREAFHVFLSKLDSVDATAIGRYRIHRDDPCAKTANPKKYKRYGASPARTLANTVVRQWSWPCVLVFVNHWLKPTELGKYPYPAIPRFLHLPDGRTVPTCVVFAPRAKADEERIEHFEFPSGPIGGGYLCFTEGQGRRQFGTLGALVTRQGQTYALTSCHVAGAAGEPVYRLSKGDKDEIGRCDASRLAKRKFCEVYPGWPGERSLLTMDTGLVRVGDVDRWSSQAFGIGQVDGTFEITPNTVTLDLVGTPVRAFGAVSGPVEGEIYGLFYRYRSAGGFDYVADLLIGPRVDDPDKEDESKPRPGAKRPRLVARPGDSGAMVFIDPPGKSAEPKQKGKTKQVRGKAARLAVEPWEEARRLLPLGILWGGYTVSGGDGAAPTSLGLATFLSTVCRELDLDLLNDLNTGHREYWGKTAHFKIGYKFCELLKDSALRNLMLANQARIGFADDKLSGAFSIGRGEFVPLADVPDYVWIGQASYSTADGPRKHEPKQHFADIDVEAADGGPSLLDLCRDDRKTNLRAEVWKRFFDGFADADWGPEEGVLPFRVAQIYEEMVGYLRGRNLKGFVGAAGVLAHYVADASIPLHMSIMHHGNPRPPRRGTEEYVEWKKSREYKIHSIFEQTMFEVRAAELLAEVDSLLAQSPPTRARGAAAARRRRGGQFALGKAFDLMLEAYTILDPKTIVESDDPELTQKERAERLYKAVGSKAAACVAAGCRTLAGLVESAWTEGRGGRLLTGAATTDFSEDEIQRLYRSSTFLPAKDLEGLIAAGL